MIIQSLKNQKINYEYIKCRIQDYLNIIVYKFIIGVKIEFNNIPVA